MEKTLRDEFAMAALDKCIEVAMQKEEFSADYAASWAYKFADAMMKQREVK